MTGLAGFDKTERWVGLGKLIILNLSKKSIDLGFQWVSWVCPKGETKCFEYKRSKLGINKVLCCV